MVLLAAPLDDSTDNVRAVTEEVRLHNARLAGDALRSIAPAINGRRYCLNHVPAVRGTSPTCGRFSFRRKRLHRRELIVHGHAKIFWCVASAHTGVTEIRSSDRMSIGK